MSRCRTVAVVGGNGQVAAEVVLRLAGRPGLNLRVIARSAGGSAFLRLRGIPVIHGDVSDPQQASRLLDDADVVAHFALASGTPRRSVVLNRQLIANVVAATSPNARAVFFSTAAVYGEWDLAGRRYKSFYGAMKRSNERLFKSLANRRKLECYIFRLGHVLGELQNIAHSIRTDIEAGPVTVPYPLRGSNVTSTEAIAEAIDLIAEGRAGPPGTYDLINLPQWTWREVYDREARRCKNALSIVGVADATHFGRRGTVGQQLLRFVNAFGLRNAAMRLSARLPSRLVDAVRANYAITRAQAEIAQLHELPAVTNSGLLWPEIQPIYIKGQTQTATLVEQNIFPLTQLPGLIPR